MSKSPEALRIYFSGTQPAKALAEGDFTVREAKIIEAAMATARTTNPDLSLLQEADAIIHRPSADEGVHAGGKGDAADETLYDESPLAELSKEIPPPESFEPDRHTLIGYLMWRWERRWRWRNIYSPIITLVVVLIVGLVVTKCSFVQDRLKTSPTLSIINFTRYDDAKKRCEKIGQLLAATPDEILARLDTLSDIEAEFGYWLRDGKVFIPKTHQIIPADDRMHGFVCVPE